MKKTTLLAAIIALFMFANCGGDSTSGKAEPMIRLSDNEFNVSSLGEDITIDILATCMWEAKSSADWITLSRAKGGIDDKYCIISVAFVIL